jgi:hypothetical protein
VNHAADCAARSIFGSVTSSIWSGPTRDAKSSSAFAPSSARLARRNGEIDEPARAEEPQVRASGEKRIPFETGLDDLHFALVESRASRRGTDGVARLDRLQRLVAVIT